MPSRHLLFDSESVVTIDQVELAVIGTVKASAQCVVAHRGGVVLALHRARRDGAAVATAAGRKGKGFNIEIVHPLDVWAEPRLSAARGLGAAWPRIDAGMTFAPMAVLADEGLIRLGELYRLVRGPADPVLALASCACVLHFDPSRGFGTSTIVRG